MLFTVSLFIDFQLSDSLWESVGCWDL